MTKHVYIYKSLFLLFIAIWAGTQTLSAQDAETLLSFGKVKFTFQNGDNSYHIECLHTKKVIPTNPDLVYCWYMQRQLHESQGCYSGYLLHGSYTVYTDNRIVIKGNYKNGIKDGLWIYLNSNGRTERQERWKDGYLNGPSITYLPGGIIKQTNYKNGKVKEHRKLKINHVIYKFAKSVGNIFHPHNDSTKVKKAHIANKPSIITVNNAPNQSR